MAKFLDTSIEIEITKNILLNNLEEYKLKYSRQQPIKFICSKCKKEEHKLFGIFWKRTTLLCHACLLKNLSTYYFQKTPLHSDDIKTICKPISKKQNIKFICENCKNEHVVQYRHYTSNICEHCKRSISQVNIWNKNGYKEYHKKCVKEKTGYDCIFQNRKLMQDAWQKKYGVGITGAMQIKKFQQKQYNTMLKLYGGYTLESKQLRKKVDITVEKIYGTKNIRNSDYYLELFEEFKDDLYKNLKRLYFYDNTYFDSSWEVAFYIWLKDNNIDFTYHPLPGLCYYSNNKQHKYYPDFIVNNQIIEIKGDQFFDKNGNFIQKTQHDKDKYKCMLTNNVILYRKNDILIYLKYVKEKYGKNYIKSFKQF